MRILSFRVGGGDTRLGALTSDGSKVVDLQHESELRGTQPDPALRTALAFLEGGDAATQTARELIDDPGDPYPVTAVELLSPVPRPLSIRGCLTFEHHLINSTRAMMGPIGRIDRKLASVVGNRRSLAGLINADYYKRLHYCKGNAGSVVGTDAAVRIPPGEKRFDYELEWGIFVGKAGVDIDAKRAHEHIAGYAIYDDFSARDIQFKDMRSHLGPTKGKDFDTGNAIGPWLVTRDEIPDPYSLTMSARVNGEQWSLGTTADMRYSFEELIAYISRSETLYPGDFISSGTCSGSRGMGCGLEQGRFLSSGDTVELEVQSVGVLRNHIR